MRLFERKSEEKPPDLLSRNESGKIKTEHLPGGRKPEERKRIVSYRLQSRRFGLIGGIFTAAFTTCHSFQRQLEHFEYWRVKENLQSLNEPESLRLTPASSLPSFITTGSSILSSDPVVKTDKRLPLVTDSIITYIRDINEALLEIVENGKQREKKKKGGSFFRAFQAVDFGALKLILLDAFSPPSGGRIREEDKGGAQKETAGLINGAVCPHDGILPAGPTYSTLTRLIMTLPSGGQTQSAQSLPAPGPSTCTGSGSRELRRWDPASRGDHVMRLPPCVSQSACQVGPCHAWGPCQPSPSAKLPIYPGTLNWARWGGRRQTVHVGIVIILLGVSPAHWWFVRSKWARVGQFEETEAGPVVVRSGMAHRRCSFRGRRYLRGAVDGKRQERVGNLVVVCELYVDWT
ncbi:hypothetical protein H6P81_002494 [Aristolochia fimbriata]|uniref:Uncharacterized protein n=1 Tax=Aristolochia fimbriata TaxID=158543 RepID=A0AAV7FB35_ARIFI|nr:hypothetical protein H6P81_002494 [Aristolochia fimbriata]